MDRTILLATVLAAVVGHCTAQVTCLTGFGSEKTEVPEEKINDGYCDCPYDGMDETETGACSGVGDWPGFHSSESTRSSFVCPQQPNLHLPLSRIHDGVCDCCDGADEPSGACPDICEQVLAEERAAREKAIKDFDVGYQKRIDALKDFAVFKEESMAMIEAAEKELETLSTTALEQQISDLKMSFLRERFTLVDEISRNDPLLSLLEPMTEEELGTFMEYVCQLSGEMETATSVDTCVPLRLAGLDVGIVWSDENYDSPNETSVTRGLDESLDLAQLLCDNASSDELSSVSWSVDKGGSPRRRLDEDFGEDYHDDYMDEYEKEYGDYGDDDYIAYESSRRGALPKGKEEMSEGKKAFLEVVSASQLSLTRQQFRSHASAVVDRITAIVDAAASEDTDEESPETTETPASNLDPAALSMTSSNLKQKEERIKRGIQYAASARVLVGALRHDNQKGREVRSTMKKLACGTLFYSKLSSMDTWKIVNLVIAELSRSSNASDEQTCASPWARFCPPQVAKRKNGQVPPESILSTAKDCCQQLVDEALQIACPVDDDQGIPIAIPDGYFGYHSIQSRTDDDVVSSWFTTLDAHKPDHTRLSELENDKKEIEKRISKMKNKIESLWKDVGGREFSDMGPGGELHSMKDTCHSIDAGKYTYEVCIFGKASQKDIGAAGGGTSLGKWSGMNIDADTGERILKWTGGQKCWNGPSRSATVHVTCGAEAKIISADEPETCRYAFVMESHIGCDESFRNRHNL